SYYILTQETQGGDQWYDYDTTYQTKLVAGVMAALWGSPGNYIRISSPGHGYGPVDFQYTSSQATAPFVTSVTSGTVRNDYSGWVGASITTGPWTLQVTQLGRMALSGNAGIHTLKLVNGSTGLDVTGGSVTVNLSGGSPGGFIYTPLAAPVSLAPNTTYYVLSQETMGGDQWYDYDTVLQSGFAAAINGGVYSGDGVAYLSSPTPGRAYVPVDFKYALP
ncbi:MAG: hypothetical protein JO336_12625, partial [Acidobacteriia bacterium]|nr:hypothetical protein [Terriglobia bacterium]